MEMNKKSSEISQKMFELGYMCSVLVTLFIVSMLCVLW